MGDLAEGCGRGGGIRTPEPLVSHEMRYQAALRPDALRLSHGPAGLATGIGGSSRGSGFGVRGSTQLLACSFGVRTGTLGFGVRASLSPPCGRSNSLAF